MKCSMCGSSKVITKIVMKGEDKTDELSLCHKCFLDFAKNNTGIISPDELSSMLSSIIGGEIGGFVKSQKNQERK